MVDTYEFKKTVKNITAQKHKIEFLGKNFEKIVQLLTDSKAEKVYTWMEKVLESAIQPISTASKQRYKQWNISELLVFRYPFQIKNTEYRVLLVKVKNKLYIEFHLGDHKYYDQVRTQLKLNKNRY